MNIRLLIGLSLLVTVMMAQAGGVKYSVRSTTGDSTQVDLIFDYHGKSQVSAIQFLVDFEIGGWIIEDASKCFSGVPSTHKGEGALSACNVLEGNRLGVTLSDVAGFTTLEPGVLGTVKVRRFEKERGLKGKIFLESVALFDNKGKRLPEASLGHPIQLQFH